MVNQESWNYLLLCLASPRPPCRSRRDGENLRREIHNIRKRFNYYSPSVLSHTYLRLLAIVLYLSFGFLRAILFERGRRFY